mgnify:CR=1 FL=1
MMGSCKQQFHVEHSWYELVELTYVVLRFCNAIKDGKAAYDLPSKKQIWSIYSLHTKIIKVVLNNGKYKQLQNL